MFHSMPTKLFSNTLHDLWFLWYGFSCGGFVPGSSFSESFSSRVFCAIFSSRFIQKPRWTKADHWSIPDTAEGLMLNISVQMH